MAMPDTTAPRTAGFTCLAGAILPFIRKIGEAHGSGIGTMRCVVEHANAWMLANKRLDRRNGRLTIVIDVLLTAACIFLIAKRLRFLNISY